MADDVARSAGMSSIRSSAPGAALTISRFSGMATNVDPHDVEVGKSIHQINVVCGPLGEMRVRPGCRLLKFDV